MKVTAVLVGAGLGLRMGGPIKKPFMQIHGKPIFIYTLEQFCRIDIIQEIIMVVGESEVQSLRETWHNVLHALNVKKIVAGGRRRQDSVYNGICQTANDTEIVLVHDVVRPFVRKEDVEKVIDKTRKFRAAILAAPMKATVKETANNLKISRTVPRDNLWMAQTPQGFERNLILKTFRQFQNTETEFTDEAQMLEKAGFPVYIVPGTDENIKITTPEDISLAEALLTQKFPERTS